MTTSDKDNTDFRIDSVHERVGLFSQQISLDVWREKYRAGDEKTPQETIQRICKAVAHNVPPEKSFGDGHKLYAQFYGAMSQGLFLPGGRVNAGVGTSKQVTLHNCYVNGTLIDSIEGIGEGLKRIMMTLKKGGGIGTDFTPLRPRYAELKGLGEGSHSSGAVSFMKVWDAASATIMSAGSRRGAMMATLHCKHPDLLEFIEAKHKKGELTFFNVSILITNEFMDAKRDGKMWYLTSKHRPTHIASPEMHEGEYIYHRILASELWDKIMQSTYEYAEPGVIFIDRVNGMNNLYYCEDIQCTNPCGEQPLPPHGACNLGHVNLARMVRNPFTEKATFNLTLLENVVRTGITFLDRIIDISEHPLDEQANEQLMKRRIGLGVSGLGNALDMLGIEYGSDKAVTWAGDIQTFIAEAAYYQSIELAKQFGPFSLYERDKYVKSGFMQGMNTTIRSAVYSYGIRNSLLLTQAPVGTGSLWFGNISSGIEPVFAHSVYRKVLQADNTWKQYKASDYGALIWETLYPDRTLPAHMKTADQVNVYDHVKMQAAVQRYVDASISKTINCAEDLSFAAFKDIYDFGYRSSLKGITTYRPSKISREVRGSILDKEDKPVAPEKELPHQQPTPVEASFVHTSEAFEDETQRNKFLAGIPDDSPLLEPRPKVLAGKTYQLKWPHREAAIYMTVNDLEGRPHEVMFTSRSMQDMPWMIGMGRMLAAMLRLEIDIHFICDELEDVRDAYESAYVDGKQYGSIVALIGATLRAHLETGNTGSEVVVDVPTPERRVSSNAEEQTRKTLGRVCPKCSGQSLMRIEGCDKCNNCGYSRC